MSLSKARIIDMVNKKNYQKRKNSLNIFWQSLKDWQVITFIVLLSLGFWWPTKNLPYHWDSAGFVINATRQILHNKFYVITNFSEFAHPPLLMLTLAFIWKIFGENILVSHLFMFSFYPILLISVYFLAKKISNKELAVVSVLLVGFMPSLVAEYGLIYMDLPMASMTILSLTLWSYRRYVWSILILCLAVMLKLPAILLVLVYIFDLIFWQKRYKDIKILSFVTLPILMVFGWIIYHYQQTGWYLNVPNRVTFHPNSLENLIKTINATFNITFLIQGKWLILLALIIALSSSMINRYKIKFDKLLFNIVLFIITSFLFFVWMGELGLRYELFFIPLYILIAVYIMQQSFKNKIWFYLFSLVIFLSSLKALHPKTPTDKYHFRPFEDLQYQDLIYLGQKAANFLELNFSNALIYGVFPESYQITQPYQGYVSKKLNFRSCKDFIYHKDQVQIIYVHAYSSYQQYCRNLLTQVDTTRLKHFEKNGKWLELYKVKGLIRVATQSGLLKP